MTATSRIEEFLHRVRTSKWFRTVLRRTRRPKIGSVDLGDLATHTPISSSWGFDRGLPIDRYYIETFLDAHRIDFRGDVVEIGDCTYSTRFGSEAIRSVDILDVDPNNPKATLTADLASAPNLSDSSFDLVLCTQTLQFVSDPQAAVETIHRILRPSGVALVTVPTISPLADPEKLNKLNRWRFTDAGIEMLFAPTFGRANCTVQAFGNLLSAVAFLHGLAMEDMAKADLDLYQQRYQMLVTVRAAKPPTS